MVNDMGPDLLDLYNEINAIYESIEIHKHTRTLVPIFAPMTDTERQREVFKRRLKGEVIDTELLVELLQEQTHESKSITR